RRAGPHLPLGHQADRHEGPGRQRSAREVPAGRQRAGYRHRRGPRAQGRGGGRMIAVVPLADAAATFAWAGCALLAGVYLTREVCPSRPPVLAVVPLAAGASAEPWPAPVGAPLSIDPPTNLPPHEESAQPEIPTEKHADTE